MKFGISWKKIDLIPLSEEELLKSKLRRSAVKGALIGLLVTTFVGMAVFLALQAQLIKTYADLISYTRTEMATMHQVNRTILDAWTTHRRK